MLPLTERLLNDAGGWQAMKAARGLHAAGRVSKASYEDGMLRGLVREGTTQYRAGLRIGSKTDIENVCTCRESRARGLVCAHSLAVGLEVLKPSAAPPSTPAPVPAAPAPEPAPTGEVRANGDVIFKSEGDWERLALHLIVPPNLADAWARGTVSLGIEAASRTGRRLCSALPKGARFAVSAEDLAALRILLKLTGGALPGALSLKREQAEQVLEAFAGSPRVTAGRGATLDVAKELAALRAKTLPTPVAPTPAATPATSSLGPTPRFFLKIEGSLTYVGAELEARTDQRRTTITSPGYRPAHPAEAAALERLRICGFEAASGLSRSKAEWALRGEGPILRFFARVLPDLQKTWEVTVGQRFEHVTRDLERVTPHFEVQGSGQNWFETGFELATDSGERLSASEIRRLLASGKRTVKLPNQKTAILDAGLLDDFEELLKDTNPMQVSPGKYRFDVRDAGYLGGFAQQREGAVEGVTGVDWQSELPFARKVEPPQLGPQWDLLRPYQKQGIDWLNALYQNKLAGVLADEMGLGKTIQTLAFLTTVPGPKLVVCPASLTLNWQREADRFAPSLRPILLTDAPKVRALIQEDRLLITSYTLMRRDIEVLRSQPLGAVVLDEAQQIKNPESQTAQAAHSLRAQARIAITGTPIENSVRDIWSMMQFLMPGYLGSKQSFRERYEIPMRDQPGGPQHRRLVRRLRPFLLRRTKRQVAKDLPEKIEQVAYCELTIAQKKTYSQVLQAARQVISDQKDPKTAGPGKMAVFTALLRLRQVCCDPRLLGQSDTLSATDSAKLDLLRELLSEAIEDGHRVLVFSQFATMLGLIRQELTSDGIESCYLDGSTRDRQAEVDRFQNGTTPVFLISLKAGGFGLNLTAADTVILYDPWWNPAVEAQAADRVHRIGQTRTVNIYRLVAKDSVEEKILALQAKKRDLAAGLIESDEPAMEGLSFDEIRSLIE